MAKEIELKDKFIIAYDTLCDGWNCILNLNKEYMDSNYYQAEELK